MQDPALQGHLRASPLIGPEGAGETVEDPSSEEERATTEGESEEEEADEAELSITVLVSVVFKWGYFMKSIFP